MKIIISALITGFLLIGAGAFADDVSIDGSGNVTTGVSNTNANLEVTGASAEDAILGSANGTGGVGVYGEHKTGATVNSFGILGDEQYGVYGESATGTAGHFQGDAQVTGNLTVGGTLTAPGVGDITSVNAGTGLSGGGTVGSVTLNVDTTSLQQRVNGTCPAGSSIRTVNTDGTVVCETDSDSGGDITSVNAGIGLTGGSLTGDAAINVDFGGTGSAETASRSDHDHGNVYQQKYEGVAVVARSGGDYSDPVNAMNNLATWCGIASSTNPCLIRIMPGIYDLGNNGLAMQSYVDIEGSGENTTTITSTHSSGTIGAASATVSGTDNAEIRFLVVENQGGSYYSFAIYNNTASPDMTNVTAAASGGSSDNYGVYNSSSSPAMTNVTATASGGSYSLGVYNSFSSPAMRNVTATASGGSSGNFGMYNNSSSPTIKTSSISGTTNSINNFSSTAKVGVTMLQGSVAGAGFTCVGAYDENFAALNTSCL